MRKESEWTEAKGGMGRIGAGHWGKEGRWRGKSAGGTRVGTGARLSHLEHRDCTRAVHLEVRGRLGSGLRSLIAALVAEAGVGDVQVAER